MILVDIFVPSVDKTYDFQLNDSIPIKLVIEEIVEMVGQKEQSEIVGDIAELQLCDRKGQIPLDAGRSLSMCGIHTGDSLILI